MPSGRERPAIGPDGSYGDWRRIDDPETTQWVQGTELAIQRWGAAYVAWVLLDDSDPRDPDTESRFVETYAGWYPSRRVLMNAHLENLGWPDAVARFRTDHDIPPHALTIDLDAIWGHCDEVYAVVERLGGVHAFLR